LRERLLQQLRTRERRLVEGVLRDKPTMTVAEAIK
jgi:FixJ family two-component response regulator